jgi:hypothetical protein
MELFKLDRLIYAAVHRDSGKTYVVKTSKHLNNEDEVTSAPLVGGGSDTHFHRALRRHGQSAFEWLVIEDDIQDLDEAECFYISYLSALGAALYNMTLGGASHQKSGERHKKRRPLVMS